MAKKKLRSRVTEEDSRTKQNAAGPNKGKTRSPVPSTPSNKASSGKLHGGGRGRGK